MSELSNLTGEQLWTLFQPSVYIDSQPSVAAEIRRRLEAAEQAEAEKARLQARVEELEGEKAEHDASFDLRWKADMRAIKRWQKSHPKWQDVWPDHADLCVWLLERIATLEAQLKQAAHIIDLYFAPWGAAKGAEWEFLSHDQPFDPEVALRLARAAMKQTKQEMQ